MRGPAHAGGPARRPAGDFQRRRQAAAAPEGFIETTGHEPVADERAPSPIYITLVMTALVLCTGLAAWSAVRDASRAFVESFDATHDRVALVTYGDGANVVAGMRSGRGFDKGGVSAAIPDGLPGGGTAMAEGFYRAGTSCAPFRSSSSRGCASSCSSRTAHRTASPASMRCLPTRRRA